MPANPQTSRHAFDFNHGDWIVTNRRLKGRGVGSVDWDVFDARQRSDLRLGGMCSLDEIDFVEQGFKGMTFRLYSPERDAWTIWWITDRDGVMQPPVMGRFEGTRGTFHGQDMDGDRPIAVVFDWQTADPNAPRWSQAFSYDGGKSWETNWIMEFRRP
ncbi:MAG: hypothetical protein WA047_06265 [Phenylobacterium sp.]|uniref:hypothetical protein n=1 Tax=Phenylobacterium sp. TaxID=1871053 RepID=UPI003BB69BE6